MFPSFLKKVSYSASTNSSLAQKRRTHNILVGASNKLFARTAIRCTPQMTRKGGGRLKVCMNAVNPAEGGRTPNEKQMHVTVDHTFLKNPGRVALKVHPESAQKKKREREEYF